MTASAEELGDIHKDLTATYKLLVSPRQAVIMVKGEPLLDEEGNPRTYTVYPSAAELAAANAFLKQNNITAPVGKSDALDDLKELMARRTAARKPAVADPYAELPTGFGGLQ